VGQNCYDCSQHTASLTIFDENCGPQVVKIVDFFSLPPFVSRSSTHFSLLISQIVQKRPKSGLRAGYSEVLTGKHVVWTDSILIEPNQRKKYKLASLLSGHIRSGRNYRSHGLGVNMHLLKNENHKGWEEYFFPIRGSLVRECPAFVCACLPCAATDQQYAQSQRKGTQSPRVK